jgi:hypothetical protein
VDTRDDDRRIGERAPEPGLKECGDEILAREPFHRPAPAEPLARRIDQFLASRGYTPPPAGSGTVAGSLRLQDVAPSRPAAEVRLKPDTTAGSTSTPIAEKAAEFVCEDDVRQAVRQGRRILLGERTIVTPAARDLGEQHRVFIQASWPR